MSFSRGVGRVFGCWNAAPKAEFSLGLLLTASSPSVSEYTLGRMLSSVQDEFFGFFLEDVFYVFSIKR